MPRSTEVEAVTAPRCPECDSQVVTFYLRYGVWTWYRCLACRFGFLWPYEAESRRQGDEITQAYAGYKPEAAREFAVEKSSWVRSFLADGIRHVIEIGPGSGQLAKALLAADPDLGYLGLETQEQFLDGLRAAGLPCQCHNISGSTDFAAIFRGFAAGRPAIVVLDNVLEHVEQPSRVLRAIHVALAPGSCILAEVPNEKWVRQRTALQDFLRGERKSPTFPGHINLFTRRNIPVLLKRQGLHDYAVSGRPIRDEYHLKYLMQSLEVPPRARLAIAAMRVMPVDRLLGLEYWLRISIRKPMTPSR
jgi:SAM-dependent methyltransferase